MVDICSPPTLSCCSLSSFLLFSTFSFCSPLSYSLLPLSLLFYIILLFSLSSCLSFSFSSSLSSFSFFYCSCFFFSLVFFLVYLFFPLFFSLVVLSPSPQFFFFRDPHSGYSPVSIVQPTIPHVHASFIMNIYEQLCKYFLLFWNLLSDTNPGWCSLKPLNVSGCLIGFPGSQCERSDHRPCDASSRGLPWRPRRLCQSSHRCRSECKSYIGLLTL